MTFEKELEQLIGRHSVDCDRNTIHYLLSRCAHWCTEKLADFVAYREDWELSHKPGAGDPQLAMWKRYHDEWCKGPHPEPEKIITFTDPARKFGEDITLGVINGDGFIMGDKARLLLEAWHREEHSKQAQSGSLEQRVETLRNEIVRQASMPAGGTRFDGLQHALAIMEGA